MKPANAVWVVVVILAMSCFALSVDDKDSRSTLRGLKGVDVVIEEIEPVPSSSGLTMKQIQTDVELHLRRAGIKVLSTEELVSFPGHPFLYIEVFINKVIDLPLYAVSIHASLMQTVKLSRDPAIESTAATWGVGTVVTLGESKLHRVRDFLSDKVDAFCNAYLSVNPK